MISGLWNDITKGTIQNSFRHAGLHANDINDSIGLAQASEPDISELWQEQACFVAKFRNGTSSVNSLMLTIV